MDTSATYSAHTPSPDDHVAPPQHTQSPLPQSVASGSPSAQSSSRTSIGSHYVELSLAACLEPWLDCFTSSTTQWGLVADKRDDGSTYQRHGIVVELVTDITHPLARAALGDELLLQRLRQAVDLVKLTLAVDPSAVESLLMRRPCQGKSMTKYEHDPNLTADELRDLAGRNVPVELRLRLEMEPIELHRLHSLVARCFMQTLEYVLVNETSALRPYLVGHALRSASARRLLNLPVRTAVSIGSYEQNAHNLSHSWRHLEGLMTAMKTMLRYQDTRSPIWIVGECRAPLVVEKIDLCLGIVPLTSPVLRTAATSMARGLPVYVTDVALDVRSMDCEEHELKALLKAITTGPDPLTIHTGGGCGSPIADLSHKIAMVLRCVGRLDHDVCLDMSGLFAVAIEREDRLAVIQGLIQDILPRQSNSTLLTLNEITLTEDDAHDITEAARHWRQDHPGLKLQLQTLELRAGTDSIDGVCALVAALDDVEDLTLHVVGESLLEDDLKMMLRFPRLRSLDVSNLSIPSMEIFSSIRETQLKRIELAGLRLAASASMVEFVKSLNPLYHAASGLSRTVENLGIAEVIGSIWSDDEDEDARDADNVAAVNAFGDVLAANNTLRLVKFGPSYDPPVDSGFTTKTSHILAPMAFRRSGVALARKVAFLSATQDGNCVYARQLDSNILRLVFAYGAPVVERTVRLWVLSL